MLIKILTYNIRHGRGMDGVVDLERICRLLLESRSDIICLQEVDGGLPRSSFINQASTLSDLLGFGHVFHANFGFQGAGMGNAILLRFPIYSTWNIRLPFMGEPRGLLGCGITVGNTVLTVFCTHWGLTPQQRLQQGKVVAGELYRSRDRYVLCGDFNAVKKSAEMGVLINAVGLTDAGPVDGYTYPSDKPVVKIDYVFGSKDITFNSSLIVNDFASDHSAVAAEFDLPA
jgi:endonuclease/exonuclease/phosphatase family metal-dependent hydrolase